MKRFLIFVTLACGLPMASWAETSAPWYHIQDVAFMTPPLQCVEALEEASLASTLRRMINVGAPYWLNDVTDQGHVVETTLRTSDGFPPKTWYRTKARCEQVIRPRLQAMDAARQQREQQLEKDLRRYR